jgi:hypothetical protein
MLMGITIYTMTSLGILMVALYMVPLKTPSGIPSADPGFQSVHALANSNFRAFQLYTNTKVEIKSLFGLGF